MRKRRYLAVKKAKNKTLSSLPSWILFPLALGATVVAGYSTWVLAGGVSKILDASLSQKDIGAEMFSVVFILLALLIVSVCFGDLANKGRKVLCDRHLPNA